MDISLNVSVGPTERNGTSTKSRNKSEFFKPASKRGATKKLSKHVKNSNNNDGTDESNIAKKINSPTTNASGINDNKRIKQKSLGMIVAKNRACINNTSMVVNDNKKKNINVTNNKVVHSEINESEKATTVSFIKNNKATGLKTILAKPRIEDRPTKSLSDIFSNKIPTDSTSDDNNLLKSNVVSGEKIIHTRIEDNSSEQSERFINNKRPTKSKMKDRKVDNKFDNTKNNSSDKPYNKFSGKISSLFGNNPDVPTIGQRLVKPVNEAVFSEKITFSDLDIHPFMVSNLMQNMSINKPTVVQQKSIPQILSGKDILIRSQTGSGKTLAYALPIVESLHKIRPKLTRNSGLRALVVVPTRELALQTYECFLKLVKSFTWIVPGYLVGGEKRKAEKARLRRGCSILVATPGRLLDHIKHTEVLKINDVKCFVLDEADRMLDMGYEKDISGIVDALKGSISQEDNSGYDAMKIFRENSKKSHDDEIINSEINTKVEEKKEIVDEIQSDNENNDSNIEDNIKTQQEYHSGTDSDNDDDQKFPIKLKELKKKNTVKNTMEKTDDEIEKPCNDDDDDDKDNHDNTMSRRQTILLSATLTNAVEKLAGLTMSNPVFVDAAEENLINNHGNLNEINEDLIVPESVIQSYVVIPPKLKLVTLSAYIAGKCQKAGAHKILVFVATQDMVDYYTDIMSSVLCSLSENDDEDADPLVDIKFFKLHGSMTQKERTEVFKTFRTTRSGVLLCTDVAARGLDMPKVNTVIQFTGPLSPRDYVHRIGRTARAGTSGTAIIFLTPPEIDFIRTLESRRIRIKQDNMNDILNNLMGPLSRHNTVEATATDLQNRFENLVISQPKFHSAACRAYTSWVRFYSTYPRDMREIFNRRDLHLGHYAKSFALRDPPQRIGIIGKQLQEKNPSKVEHNNRLSVKRPEHINNQKQQRGNNEYRGPKPGLLKRSRMLNTSEYGDGLEPIKKSKK
ncbi:hypothetical protein PV328_005566 [Microctonus aethiopoides]|uniref:ATP-dependent RNA helicase n=1 Tax=Microctonus aethiopoides TaxID=144406 RepID=A0AA39FMZ0_9HYME|nr:hypothetical protein PV328_005566 [Microctonus aethiopoides]